MPGFLKNLYRLSNKCHLYIVLWGCSRFPFKGIIICSTGHPDQLILQILVFQEVQEVGAKSSYSLNTWLVVLATSFYHLICKLYWSPPRVTHYSGNSKLLRRYVWTQAQVANNRMKHYPWAAVLKYIKRQISGPTKKDQILKKNLLPTWLLSENYRDFRKHEPRTMGKMCVCFSISLCP
jgi:hypothetical protein